MVLRGIKLVTIGALGSKLKVGPTELPQIVGILEDCFEDGSSTFGLIIYLLFWRIKLFDGFQ